MLNCLYQHVLRDRQQHNEDFEAVLTDRIQTEMQEKQAMKKIRPIKSRPEQPMVVFDDLSPPQLDASGNASLHAD